MKNLILFFIVTAVSLSDVFGANPRVNGVPVMTVASNLTDLASRTASRINLGDSFSDSNTDIVQAGPYDHAASGAANFGPLAGETSIDWIARGHTYRIRQNGNVQKLKLYVGPKTGLTHFYAKVWRQTGTTTWDLIATSEDILGSLTASTINTVTLATPFSVQEGDFIGARAEYSAASVQNFFVKSSTVTTNLSVINATPSATGYNWDAQTPTPAVTTPIEVLMTAPKFVTIGDSIMSGLPGHSSFVYPLQDQVSIPNQIGYQIGTATGYSYQNMGVGSDILTGISGRFNADALASRPKFVVIEGGVNDLIGGTATNSMITSWTAMLDACIASNVVPVALGIFPFRTYSLATDAKLRSRDAVNAMIQSLVLARGGFYVNPDPYIGRFYSAGDAGNTWQLQAAADSGDGLHPSLHGYARMAQAVLDAIAPGPLKGGGTFGTLNLQGNMRIDGSSPRTVEMTPNSRYKQTGSALTVRAGAASLGQTDLNGGDLVLESGISSGTGTSKISFNVPSIGTTGTAANVPAESFRLERTPEVGASYTRLISSSADSIYRTYAPAYKGGIGYDSGLNAFGIFPRISGTFPTFYVDDAGDYTVAPTTFFKITGATPVMRLDGSGASSYWIYKSGAFQGGFGYDGTSEIGLFRQGDGSVPRFGISNTDETATFRNTNSVVMTGGTSVKLKVIGNQDTADQNSANAYINSTTTRGLWFGYNTTSGKGLIGAVNNGVQFDPLILNPSGGTFGVGVSSALPLDFVHLRTNGAANVRFEVGPATAGIFRVYGQAVYKGGVGWNGGTDFGLYDSADGGTPTLYVKGSDTSGGFRGLGVFTVSRGGLSAYRAILPKTSNSTITEADCFKVYSNAGAAGEVDFTLPAWISGQNFTFTVTDAQVLKVIAPASVTIYVGSAIVSSAGGSISANAIGASVTLIAVKSNMWIAQAVTGTWSAL